MSRAAEAIIIFLILTLLIGGAGATQINSTVLMTTNYFSDLKLSSSDAFTTKDYSFSAPSANSIVVNAMNYYTEGEIINFRLVRPTATDITGQISLVSTGIFWGEERISIDGGTTAVIQYYKFPVTIGVSLPMYATNTMFFVTTGSDYYFVVVDSSRFNYAVSGDIQHPVYAPIKIDTESDAILEIYGTPDQNPITQIVITPVNSGSYTAMTYYEPVTALKEAVHYTNSTQAAQTTWGDLSFLQAFIRLLTNGINTLIAFLQTAATLSTWLLAIAAFLLATKAFVGIVALYTIINMIYCMDPRLGFIAAVTQFIENEKKLAVFLIGIITWIKDLIKWW